MYGLFSYLGVFFEFCSYILALLLGLALTEDRFKLSGRRRWLRWVEPLDEWLLFLFLGALASTFLASGAAVIRDSFNPAPDYVAALERELRIQDALPKLEEEIRTARAVPSERARVWAERLPDDVSEYALGLQSIAKGDFEQAQEHLDRAKTSAEGGLGRIYSASGLVAFYEGNYAEAAGLYSRASTLLPDDLGLRLQGGIAEYEAGSYGLAEETLRDYVETLRTVHGTQDIELIQGLNNLATVYLTTGRYGEAESLLRESLDILETEFSLSRPEAADTYHRLGVLYTSQASWADAEQAFSRAIPIAEGTRSSPDATVFAMYNDRGTLKFKQGDLRGAEDDFAHATSLAEEVFGQYHPNVADALNNLAVTHLNLGLYEDSIDELRRVSVIYETVLGRAHPDTGAAKNNVASVLERIARYEEAEPIYREALSVTLQAYGSEHPQTATLQSNVALNLYNQDRYEEAKTGFLNARDTMIKAMGSENHPDVLQIEQNLATTYSQLDEFELAEVHYKRALEGLLEYHNGSHPNLAVVLNNLGAFYVDKGDFAEGLPVLADAVEMRRQELGIRHIDVGDSLRNLARACAGSGLAERAEAAFQEALEIIEGAIEEQDAGPLSSHPYYIDVIADYAVFLEEMGRIEQAAALRERL